MNTLYKRFIFLLLILNTVSGFSQREDTAIHDSIVSWIKKAKNKKLSLEERMTWIKKSETSVDRVQNDSLRNNCLYKIENFYLNSKDSLKFRFYNDKGLRLSLKIKDSIKIANYNWDKGFFYNKHGLKDSAFAHYVYAKKIHSILQPDGLEVGKLLLNMASIQKDLKDYTGSETNTIKAIKIFKQLDDKKRQYSSYNNLGIIFKNLKQYGKALEYHKKALTYLNDDNSIYKSLTLNNIGLIHKYQKNYKEAIIFFKRSLNIDSLFLKKPKQYSIALDNLAHTKLLSNDTIGIKNLFYESLHIKDSLKFLSGIGISKLHLAEYYLKVHKDTLKSFEYAIEAKNQLKEIKFYDLLLKTYDLLAKVDPKNGTKYLRRYIQISDSLLMEERRMREKYTRIEFETKEVEDKFAEAKLEALKLGNEANTYKQRNQRVYLVLWWLGGSIIVIAIVLFVRNYQRTLRNKYEKVVLQQQLLRSQMNPHFLFNTLNTILHSTDAKPEKTKQYVLKLSKLLRTTLENSREEFVPLQDEIVAIDNYLNLQSNFSEKFDFNITITDDLETEFVYVPPMLIQPFVENAIIHGITNSEIRGVVALNFSKQKDLISCIITDNGIGYSKSPQEEKSDEKGHTSISGDIVKERLAIYNKQNSTNASLKIENILDDEKKVTGTKVILNLPSYEI